MSALTPKKRGRGWNVRFVPIADITLTIVGIVVLRLVNLHFCDD